MRITDVKWQEFVNLINRQEYVNSESKYELTYDSFRNELEEWIEMKTFTDEEWKEFQSELAKLLQENEDLRDENEVLKYLLNPEVQQGLQEMKDGKVVES